ncbi:PLP-dependent transferase [Shewanella sp. Scap07]|uniref:trans-sulfuration enzyme family protein n=1 Tax=Shewanella sp. Scap07 TaxID=2589987 RepID=UPI0015BC2A2F|nr:PLP-dependent aspartate aminotransferase family protein [Shewanella sp. Scap07]QLE84993.1 PLP-dependent transferase [Shewanella sp. Scap07]
MQDRWKQATQLVHAGHEKDPSGALVSPLYQSATFTFSSAEQGGRRFAGDEPGYIYTRLGNPTTSELERKVAVLEGAQAAAATASGMAAVSTALLSYLSQGDHLVASNAVYGCTYSFMTEHLPRYGVKVSLVDCKDIAAVSAAITPQTKVLFFETPVNPHLDVFDIAALTALARERGVATVVDNTFMTPLLQQPLKLGADMVIHSATKYLNGHGDVIAGMVCGSQEMIDKAKYEVLKDFGGVLSPHDAWLILRGMKTLDVRLSRHCSSAGQIAEYLDNHPLVDKVYYPGLKNHKGYALLGKQMKQAGGVIAFELKQDLAGSIAFVNRLKLWTIAVSLGDAESLIQHPASMTHSPYSPEERQAAGITDNLLRLSVGLEDCEDLIADLAQAFK